MPGRFEGFSDPQWDVLQMLVPPEPSKRGKGMPHANFRGILNTIAYVLITGSRWCDVPQGPQWGARTTAHRWLGKWKADGTLERLKTRLLTTAEMAGLVDWTRATVDGSFSPREGRRSGSRARLQRKGGHVA